MCRLSWLGENMSVELTFTINKKKYSFAYNDAKELYTEMHKVFGPLEQDKYAFSWSGTPPSTQVDCIASTYLNDDYIKFSGSTVTFPDGTAAI
jgi:hypothetical protein